MNYIIYTDGSVYDNKHPTVGGYAFVVVLDDKIIHKQSEAFEMTTNNQSELSAITEALFWFRDNCDPDDNVTVFSDSEYCVEGYNEWMENWKKRGWKRSSGKPSKNRFHWKRLDELKVLLNKRVKLQWCKGHSGIEYNELVDDMARGVWKKHYGFE